MPQTASDKEIEFCKKMGVPVPTLEPLERFRTLMAFRNEWKLYRRKCDATGEEILSAYAKDSPFKVYKNSVWWGDTWDALEYGRDYDFSKTFFEQFKELQLVVPREGTSIFNCENCDHNSHIRESRNCYLNSLVAKCEDLYYSYWMVNDKNVFDSMITNDSTLCYYCSNVNKSYGCFFLEEANNCTDCHFCYQIHGCNNCIFSSNIANKSYYAFNKKCTKEEFAEIKKKYINGSFKSLEEGKKEFEKMRKEAKQRAVHNLNCENTTGDHMYNCKNCENSYEGFNSEDCVNSISLGDATSAYSCYSAGWPNCPGPVYMSLVSRACQDVAFGNYNWYSSKLRYCEGMNTCDSCLGCIGLRHKNYCILNKQYTKEEYYALIPKVIAHMEKTGEWGQFFPKNLSAFAYNETAAQDFFPLEKEQAIKMGYKWRDEEAKNSKPATTEIPENIKDAPDTFIKEVLACDTCKSSYKIIEPELRFYKQSSLPIPRICPECRYKERALKRNPFALFKRNCSNCGTEIDSTFSPDRKEVVYCEKCYLEAVE
ncbi:MAG: hypothetical protein Q8P62_02540 [Candidatus Peregrinibacteria bacterium]|nr:hypothetical protein [Candidatus Peregrinibacteria bacterium]